MSLSRSRTFAAAVLVTASIAIRFGIAFAAPHSVESPHDVCTGCHRTSAGRGTALVACASCHESHRTAFAADSTAHGFACIRCHDPHTSGPHRLRRSLIESSDAPATFDAATRLCVACHFHAGAFTGHGGGFVRHPVGLPVPAHDASVVAAWSGRARARTELSLPLVASADHPDGVIGCTTCHVAHDDGSEDLLRWTPDRQVAACMSCHRAAIEPSEPAEPVVAAP